MNGDRTNRPKSNALYQQELKAWKPLMTYKDASIFFIVTGLILVGIGVAIFFADKSVYQVIEDYTDCIKDDIYRNTTCSSVSVLTTNCSCKIDIQINETIPSPVYFYYGITNYYQNHRQLFNSYNMKQLMGVLIDLSGTCQALKKDEIPKYSSAPCGALPNVIFNDTFSLERNNEVISWTNRGIALKSDLLRYNNPPNWNNTIKPPNWPDPIYDTYSKGYQGNENLMVWIRGSPLPSIRKLHHILNNTGDYKDGLPIGKYSITINYRYPVKDFGGRKSFIISNASWMGSKNPSMFILYFVTGIIEILIGIILIPIHVNYIINSLKQNAATISVEM